MTGDDRQYPERGGPDGDRGRHAFLRPAPPVDGSDPAAGGPGGLLDGLPEAGRGAPRATPDTAAEAQPNVIPLRGGGPERGRVQAASALDEVAAPVTPPGEVSDPPDEAPGPPEPAGTDVGREGDRGSPSDTHAHAYAPGERDAVYRAIRERRDVRVGFRSTPVPDDVLTRVLGAAHRAPSVGFSQPWDFVVIQDEETRSRVRRLAEEQRDSYARALPGARARAFSGLKVEAILDTPLNIAVTADRTRGGRHTLGRHVQPQTGVYSTALAVQNLWLAARAEGLGVGWVSFFAERDLADVLELPQHLEVVAYLCVGYVDDFPPEPELAMGGWAQRRPLSWTVHREQYGRRGLPGEEPTSLLEETIAATGPPSQRAITEARERQDRMTKPPGSLGALEELSVRLAGLAGECPPPLPEPAAVAVFAGDHGVHSQHVTNWPQEVTVQMVGNFLDGGAVVNAFAAQAGAEVTVVDVGVAGDLPNVPGLLPRKVARGTADLSQGPAMPRGQAGHAIEAGVEVARDLVSAGNRCLVTGDMGIANTTPSAALVAAFTGAHPADITGSGAGADAAMREHKMAVVRRALEVNRPDPGDPVGVLAAVGGLEHAALAGLVIGAAALRVPVLLDGVVAGAAALAAVALAPDAAHVCFAGHRSTEPGHAVVLDHLGLRPVLDLDMRLGEGSGALLALPILQSAARVLHDVATFDSAGVSRHRR